MEKIIDWLFSDNVAHFFDAWFAGNGFAFLFACGAVVLMIALCFSKRLRRMLF